MLVELLQFPRLRIAKDTKFCILLKRKISKEGTPGFEKDLILTDNITEPEFITFFETILSNKSRLIPNLSECVTLQAQNMHFLNSKLPKNRRSEPLPSTKKPKTLHK